jgi:hypothetical protein
MTEEAGVRLGGDFYPFDVPIKTTDGRLIREATGLSFREWAQALNAGEFEGVLGLTACSIARSHPDWRRDDVVHYLESFDMDQFQEILPKTGVKESPPAQEEVSETTSSKQPTTSDSDQESPSTDSTVKSIGPPDSLGGQREPSRLTA